MRDDPVVLAAEAAIWVIIMSLTIFIIVKLFWVRYYVTRIEKLLLTLIHET